MERAVVGVESPAEGRNPATLDIDTLDIDTLDIDTLDIDTLDIDTLDTSASCAACTPRTRRCRPRCRRWLAFGPGRCYPVWAAAFAQPRLAVIIRAVFACISVD